MMSNELIEGVVILLVVLAGYGYGSNIFKLANCDFKSPYKCEVLHAAGIVPIVGIFAGYVDVGK